MKCTGRKAEPIYQRVNEMLCFVYSNFSPEINDLLKFSAETAEADFLFGLEISKYIDEIYSRGIDLHTAKAEYRDFRQPVPAGYDHQKVVDAMMAQEKWFIAQPSVAKEKFRTSADDEVSVKARWAGIRRPPGRFAHEESSKIVR